MTTRVDDDRDLDYDLDDLDEVRADDLDDDVDDRDDEAEDRKSVV